MDQKHWTIVQDIINLAKIDTSQTQLYLQQLLFLTQKSYDELFLMKYELTLVSLNNFDFLNNFKEIGKTCFYLRCFVTVMAFLISKFLFIIMLFEGFFFIFRFSRLGFGIGLSNLGLH